MDVRMPDGTIIQNVPDNITQGELLARYQKSTQATAAAKAPPLWEQFPELAGGDAAGQIKAAGVGLGYGLDRTAAGLRELTPEPVRGAVDRANAVLNVPALGGNAPPPSIAAADWKANKAALAPLEAKYPFTMGVTEAGPMLAAPTPATMGAMAALSYNTPRDRLLSGALTYGGAKALDLAARGLTKAFAGKAVSQDVRDLLDQGVVPTPGQMAGFKSTEEKAMSAPIIGQRIKNAQIRAVESVNTATYRRALSEFGDDGAAALKNVSAGHEGVAAVGDFLSGQYDASLSRSVPTAIDDQLKTDVIAAAAKVPSSMGKEYLKILQQTVTAPINDTTSGMAGATITPEAAKRIEGELGNKIQNYVHSSIASERDLGFALKDVQTAVRNAVARSNPAEGPTIQKINRAWAQLVPIERAAGYVGAKEGVFTPPQYLRAIKASDKSVRDRAFARGTMPNQAFAELADRVISNKLPNSGSTDRGAAIATLWGLISHPLATGGGLLAGVAGSLPYTSVGQRGIASVLAGKYAQSPLQQEILHQLATRGGGLLGPAAGGLLGLTASQQ